MEHAENNEYVNFLFYYLLLVIFFQFIIDYSLMLHKMKIFLSVSLCLSGEMIFTTKELSTLSFTKE